MPLQSGLLEQWTQFLVEDSLVPADQVSTDNFAGSLANQTNLAIKGIVGIQAMAEVARLTDDMTKYTNYSVRIHILCFVPLSSAHITSRRLRPPTSSNGRITRWLRLALI